MAGSYNHATTDDGKLRSPETMSNATENQGDAYETIEEMYGMIWWLADLAKISVETLATLTGSTNPKTIEELVEAARTNWEEGMDVSPGRES